MCIYSIIAYLSMHAATGIIVVYMMRSDEWLMNRCTMATCVCWLIHANNALSMLHATWAHPDHRVRPLLCNIFLVPELWHVSYYYSVLKQLILCGN